MFYFGFPYLNNYIWATYGTVPHNWQMQFATNQPSFKMERLCCMNKLLCNFPFSEYFFSTAYSLLRENLVHCSNGIKSELQSYDPNESWGKKAL